MPLLSFLFRSNPQQKPSSAWTQTQREALVDLLYYAIYADNHLSAAEETRIATELEKVEWDGPLSVEQAIERAIHRARDARSDPAAKTRLLASVKLRLSTETAISKAAALCEEVLRADGLADKESPFLAEVRAALGL